MFHLVLFTLFLTRSCTASAELANGPPVWPPYARATLQLTPGPMQPVVNGTLVWDMPGERLAYRWLGPDHDKRFKVLRSGCQVERYGDSSSTCQVQHFGREHAFHARVTITACSVYRGRGLVRGEAVDVWHVPAQSRTYYVRRLRDDGEHADVHGTGVPVRIVDESAGVIADLSDWRIDAQPASDSQFSTRGCGQQVDWCTQRPASVPVWAPSGGADVTAKYLGSVELKGKLYHDLDNRHLAYSWQVAGEGDDGGSEEAMNWYLLRDSCEYRWQFGLCQATHVSWYEQVYVTEDSEFQGMHDVRGETTELWYVPSVQRSYYVKRLGNGLSVPLRIVEAIMTRDYSNWHFDAPDPGVFEVQSEWHCWDVPCQGQPTPDPDEGTRFHFRGALKVQGRLYFLDDAYFTVPDPHHDDRLKVLPLANFSPHVCCDLDSVDSYVLLSDLDPDEPFVFEVTDRAPQGHYDYALLAADAYNDQAGANVAKHGWVSLPPFGFEPQRAGFAGRAYFNPAGKQFVIAYRGTELGPSDLFNDYFILRSKVMPQFDDAETLVLTLRSFMQSECVAKAGFTFTSDSVVFVGHSLGAALAELAASRFGSRSVTLSSPGVREIMGKDDTGRFDIAFSDGHAVTYALPGAIETTNGHVGEVRRAFHELPLDQTYVYMSLNSIHSKDSLLSQFVKKSGMPRVYGRNSETFWPGDPRSPVMEAAFGINVVAGLRAWGTYATNTYFLERRQVYLRKNPTSDLLNALPFLRYYRQDPALQQDGIAKTLGYTLVAGSSLPAVFQGTAYADHMEGGPRGDHFYTMGGCDTITDPGGLDHYYVPVAGFGCQTIDDRGDGGARIHLVLGDLDDTVVVEGVAHRRVGVNYRSYRLVLKSGHTLHLGLGKDSDWVHIFMPSTGFRFINVRTQDLGVTLVDHALPQMDVVSATYSSPSRNAMVIRARAGAVVRLTSGPSGNLIELDGSGNKIDYRGRSKTNAAATNDNMDVITGLGGHDVVLVPDGTQRVPSNSSSLAAAEFVLPSGGRLAVVRNDALEDPATVHLVQPSEISVYTPVLPAGQAPQLLLAVRGRGVLVAPYGSQGCWTASSDSGVFSRQGQAVSRVCPWDLRAGKIAFWVKHDFVAGGTPRVQLVTGLHAPAPMVVKRGETFELSHEYLFGTVDVNATTVFAGLVHVTQPRPGWFVHDGSVEDPVLFAGYPMGNSTVFVSVPVSVDKSSPAPAPPQDDPDEQDPEDPTNWPEPDPGSDDDGGEGSSSGGGGGGNHVGVAVGVSLAVVFVVVAAVFVVRRKYQQRPYVEVEGYVGGEVSLTSEYQPLGGEARVV